MMKSLIDAIGENNRLFALNLELFWSFDYLYGHSCD